jgi:UPF0755 protein
MVKFFYRKNKNRRNVVTRIILSSIMLITIVTAIFYIWYKVSLNPVSVIDKRVTYRVEVGDNPTSTALRLKEDKLIKSELAFRLFIKLNNYNSILPGEYQLSTSYDARKIADILFNSNPEYTKVIFLPGKTLADYRQALLDAGYNSQDVSSALSHNYTNLSLADKPLDQSLEGYIRPQTYTKLIKLHDSPKDIITQNLKETDALITDDFRAGIASKKLNIHQAFTLASIIQQESSDPQNQKQIAQVFYSRLELGMALGSDVTFQYAAKITGQLASPELDSPYNTRINSGLPPGPIGGFTQSALEAVLNPADGDYLFFVAGDDGVTYFSRTNDEHEALKNAHCHRLCSIY